MSTFTNTAREVEMPNGDVVVIHNAPTGGENTTSNIKKFKYDDNGHVTESTAADAEDLNLSGYSTPTTGSTDIGTSDDVQTAIGKLDHQSHIDQTNILLVQDATEELVDEGAKNIFDVQTPDTMRDTSIVPLANGGITISCTNAIWTNYKKSVSVVPNKSYRFMIYVDSISEGLQNFDVVVYSNETTPVLLGKIENIHTTGTYHLNLTPTADNITVWLYLNDTATAKTQSANIRALLCPMAKWNISQNYAPFALQNYDLTRLQVEDRAALVECVDEGTKNRFDDIGWANDVTVKDGTKSVSNGAITLTATATDCYTAFILPGYPAKYNVPVTAGETIVMSWDYTAHNSQPNDQVFVFPNGSTTGLFYVYAKEKKLTYTVPTGITYLSFRIGVHDSGDSATYSNIMFCTKAKWDISHEYEPHALPNTDLTRMVNDLQKKAVKVYTYHVNPNESDPEDAVTYLDDATGLTPAKMGASSFSYGSWANAWFLPRPCMLKSDGTVAYYLNPNDYSKKTDGTASDIADANFDGNVMLEFPKIWVKRVASSASGERTVSIAPVNVDGTYKCWSNINAEDKKVDHFYLPAYNGTIHSSKMRSLSGVTLDTTYAPNYTRAQEVTAATANNPSGKNMWYTETWADFCLIYDLLYLMGKSLDVQRTFGQGLSSGAETAMRAYVTGTHNAKGLFYGDVSGTSTAVKVLGMENLWGCRWRGVAGLINDNGTLKVKMTYGVADGSTTVGYNTTGDGYLNYGSTYGTAGFVKKMQADNAMGYKIIETAGTDATYYCDYYYANNAQLNYALMGGAAGSGTNCGFSVNVDTAPAYAGWYIGVALSCRP